MAKKNEGLEDQGVTVTTEIGQGAPLKQSKPSSAELKPITVLSVKYRLASWQLAALLRLMNWQDDKQVTESEFANALAALTARPLGG